MIIPIEKNSNFKHIFNVSIRFAINNEENTDIVIALEKAEIFCSRSFYLKYFKKKMCYIF